MRARSNIATSCLIGLASLLSAVPVFACWQVGHGYDAVRTSRLIFVYEDHGRPVKGAHFELHKANWAYGAPDDQSNVGEGSSKPARWQTIVVSAGSTNETGSVDLGRVSPGKYYVVLVETVAGKRIVGEGFPIEVLVPLVPQQSQTLWLNYFADGCSEVFATDPGVQPKFTKD